VHWEPDARGVKIAKDPHGDMCDAVLYAYRACWHFLEEASPEKPRDDGDAHWRKMEERAAQPWFERDQDIWT
jgi:hypothetical protein